MARVTGTITQLQVRNLTADAAQALFDNTHRDLAEKHGPGVFNKTHEPNGDIAWTYDYAETFRDAPPKSHLSAGLTPEQVEAVFHARSLLCTKGHVKLVDGVYVSTLDPKDDPAIPGLMTTINTLEGLLVEYDRGSVSVAG